MTNDKLTAEDYKAFTFDEDVVAPPRPVILYRPQGGLTERAEELAAAQTYFPVIERRTQAQAGQLIIGRYSVLPFYRELAQDLESVGARLVNSPSQHEYVADLRNWYGDLQAMTPKTWFRLEDIDEDGPFVLKGGTNSRKQDWSTHMYAKDRREAGEVYSRLASDGLIGRQEIVIRRYEKLVTYGHAIGGLPITKEFRTFVLHGHPLATGYYWDAFLEDIGRTEPPTLDPSATVLGDAIEAIGDKCAFYAIDVAEREDGSHIIVEVNDGQMAGASGIPIRHLYARLAQVLDSTARNG